MRVNGRIDLAIASLMSLAASSVCSALSGLSGIDVRRFLRRCERSESWERWDDGSDLLTPCCKLADVGRDITSRALLFFCFFSSNHE